MDPIDAQRELYFDRAVVLTLRRRTDRRTYFFNRYQERVQIDAPTLAPFPEPEVHFGIDSKILDCPDWFAETPGNWAGRSSHIRILEDAVTFNVERLLVFEDDADLAHGEPGLFTSIRDFLQTVPEDWDFAQLGYNASKSSHVAGAFREARHAMETHAIAYNGRSIPKIYRALVSLPLIHRNLRLLPIDRHLNHLSNQGKLRRYLPKHSLIPQVKALGSDIQPH